MDTRTCRDRRKRTCRCRRKESSKRSINKPTRQPQTTEIAADKNHQGGCEKTMGQRMEWKHKNGKSTMTHHQKERSKDRAKALQWDTRYSTNANRPLWIKPLSTSLQQMKLPILWMWHGKRNRGTLSVGMSKIQRAEEENDKRDRKGETECWETTTPTTNNKAHDRVYQEHKTTRIIRWESEPERNWECKAGRGNNDERTKGSNSKYRT